jgi:hypothetical protein
MKFDGCEERNVSFCYQTRITEKSYPLSNYVADGPRHNNIVVLILVKIEIFLHPRNESISDVRSVNLRSNQ